MCVRAEKRPREDNVQITIGPKNDVDLRAITAAKSELRECAERDPEAKGKVVFAITVDSAGAVSIVSIPMNGVGGPTATCFTSVVRKTRFDAAARTFELDLAITR